MSASVGCEPAEDVAQTPLATIRDQVTFNQ